MDLLILVFVLSLVGFGVCWITENIPMAPMFKTVIIFIAVIVMLLYVLRVFGVSLPNVLP